MVSASICLLCRGAKYLCGKPYCPILARARATVTLSVLKAPSRLPKDSLFGSSPPSVFVGRFGYPKVALGPSAPPLRGDTSTYDLPEAWLNLKLEDVLAMRLSLVRGYGVVNVKNAWSPTVMKVQEVALSEKPVEIEVEFLKPPRPEPLLAPETPPMGPRAPAKRFRVVGNARFPKPLSKAYYDTDLKATDAIIELYRSGLPVSSIQKALSVGALGTGRRRRLVPTRWAITAVDDTVSRHLVRIVKELPEFSEYLLFIREHARNLFIAIIIPGQWSFEWMEAWFPGSTWNPNGITVSLEGDWEGPGGRSEYASIGGCYYAARLATAEFMLRTRRKGMAVLYREIYPGFNLPIGVWYVRENLRALFRGKPKRFSSLEELLRDIKDLTKVPLNVWVRRSAILSKLLRNRRLDEYAVKHH